MRNSKLFCLLFWISLICAAEHLSAQVRVGITIGPDFSKITGKDEAGATIQSDRTTNLRVGLTADIPVASNFYIQPGILYSGKGFEQSDNRFSGQGNEFKVNVSYIEVPLHLLYKPNLGTGNIILGTGPYLAYGTGGQWKSLYDITIGDIRLSNHGNVVFKDDEMDGEFGAYTYGKPWDYGVSFLAGYELMHKLSLQLNGQFGLANLQSKLSGVAARGKINNSVLSLSVGYKF
jgi:hypothetical protein